MRTKLLRIIGILFTAIGLLLFIAAAYSAVQARDFLQRAVATQGQVTELLFDADGDVYCPIVRFSPGPGRTVDFRANTGSNPPAYSAGQPVPVRYDPAEPQHAYLDDGGDVWFASILLAGMGAIFALIGGIIVIGWWLSVRKRRWLLRHGTWIEADFVGVEKNVKLDVNGRHPCNLVAQWLNPGTHTLHRFVSDNLWLDDPAPFIKDTLRVIIDPRNPHRYWVDTSFLPKADERLGDVLGVRLG